MEVTSNSDGRLIENDGMDEAGELTLESALLSGSVVLVKVPVIGYVRMDELVSATSNVSSSDDMCRTRECLCLSNTNVKNHQKEREEADEDR